MPTDTPGSGCEVATLGGGCFWCLEAVFDELAGVASVVSGYTGGHTANPDYHQVCSGDSGHVEVVQVSYDPARISYREILDVFFAIHDPTTLNRQGNDTGTQYRSAIYYHSQQQKAVAAALLDTFASTSPFGAPVVTTLTAAETFYPAEAYHQKYFTNNARQPYCQFVVSPKLVKFRQLFAAKRKVK
ncbi:MAG: peptide-methionine (S)-S-oxide reductase MsrA [Sulfuritalea sp.]|nr:peptide-methionine (S)-S-oxide reductase MsrA [Sulfuritalea sp.]